MDYLDPIFLIRTVGLIGVFALVFAESGLFFGFFLPGDSLLFTAGLLASQGYMDITVLCIGIFIAAVLGDNFGYHFGKHFGPKIFAREDSFFFNKKHIETTNSFYKKYGKKAIILARFIPVVRTFTPIFAGVGEMSYKTFLSYNIIGGALWSFGVTLAGYFIGTIVPGADKYIIPIIILIILLSILPPLLEIIKNNIKKSRKGF
jgi:membrane-associated protein